jgi:hypothetical protein
MRLGEPGQLSEVWLQMLGMLAVQAQMCGWVGEHAHVCLAACHGGLQSLTSAHSRRCEACIAEF